MVMNNAMPSRLAQLKAQTGSTLLLLGGSGLVGRALQRAMSGSCLNVLAPSHQALDCTQQRDVMDYFDHHRPDVMIVAAGKVGGIAANQCQPADFAYANLMINANLLQAAHHFQVKRTLLLGSSCIYPKFAAQPMAESALLQGALEPTNEAYAIAKIAALKLGHSYLLQHGMDIRALMPTNLYGPFDHFNDAQSHVIPGLMWRLRQHIAQQSNQFPVWGRGVALREFLHVDDLANAILTVLSLPVDEYRRDWSSSTAPLLHEYFYNVGSDDEISIAELVQQLVQIAGFTGEIVFQTDKPDGTLRKRLDCSRLQQLCQWRASHTLADGLADTWRWYLTHHAADNVC